MSETALRVSVAVLTALSCTAAAHVNVSAHIPGAKCMSLNLTHEQMLDRGISIPIRSSPNALASEIGTPGATVIVRDPSVAKDGFVEIMMPNGVVGWLEARWLRPWQPVPGLATRCRPAQMSNGRLGFDYR